ncbi:MAG: NAD(P)H-quinone oxidoreductase [Gammaproteobacteria bacterium]|jgi:putative PIG3 family NAD(P)H quinone oxidoreductase
MKAVILDSFGPPDVMRVDEIDAPSPGPGQVLIEVAATSVNRPDIVQRQGYYPPPKGESEILGLECAGTIVEVGEGVGSGDESPSVGDRVFALVAGGGYAELAVAEASHVVPIPDDMPFEQAACIAETYITAYLNLFREARLGDGEAVLLHGGGGGVNAAAIQLVDALCPSSQILVTASEHKLKRVEALGVDLVIDYRASDFAAEVKSFTTGHGTDVILDHIGAGYLDKNLEALAVNGRLVVIGVMQGSDAKLSLGRLMIKRQRIIGSVLRLRPREEKAGIIADFAKTVMPLFQRGRIAPLIDSLMPLERVADAHRRMESSEHFGKIVLVMD